MFQRVHDEAAQQLADRSGLACRFGNRLPVAKIERLTDRVAQIWILGDLGRSLHQPVHGSRRDEQLTGRRDLNRQIHLAQQRARIHLASSQLDQERIGGTQPDQRQVFVIHV